MGIFSNRRGDGGSTFVAPVEDNVATESNVDANVEMTAAVDASINDVTALESNTATADVQTNVVEEGQGEAAVESSTDNVAMATEDDIDGEIATESLQVNEQLDQIEQQLAEAATESSTEEVEVVAAEPVIQVQVVKPFDIQPVFAQLRLADAVDQSVGNLQDTLRDRKMVAGLAQVARDNNLSAPMATAFHAMPGFDAAVESFPSADVFNVVVEHKTSDVNVQGLEALDNADTKVCSAMQTKSAELVTSFGTALEHLGVVATNFEVRFTEVMQALDASDMTEEVLATLPVTAVNADTMSQVMTKLHDGFMGIEAFNTDELQGNPERVVLERKGLQAGMESFGDLIGAQVSEFGLESAPKNVNHIPTAGTFEEKAITGAGLGYAVTQAVQLVDDMKALVDRKDELVAALNVAVENMPAEIDGDDVTYGRSDHVALLGSYVGLVNGMVREATMSLTNVLSVTDAALYVDSGVQEV